MATYVAKGAERLYELADGNASDWIKAFALQAGDGWRGQMVLAPTEEVNLPVNVETFQPTDDVPEHIQALRDSLYSPSPVEHIRPAQVFVHPETGNGISLAEAIPYEIVNRLLTYRPHRWMRPAYGSKMADVFGYFLSLIHI